jgi:hypothetical protein
MQISIITYLGRDSDEITFKIKKMVMLTVACSCSLQKLVCVSELVPAPRNSGEFLNKTRPTPDAVFNLLAHLLAFSHDASNLHYTWPNLRWIEKVHCFDRCWVLIILKTL